MENDYLPLPKGFSTNAIHAGQDPEMWDSMSVVPPIVLSSTFKQYSPANFKKYVYGRDGNPSRNVLEECLAAIENAKYGMCFSTGTGVMSTLLGMLQTGNHIISGDDIYGGTSTLLTEFGSQFGLEISYVDATKPTNVENAIKPNTKLIWLETPTNPSLKVMDIEAISNISKKHNIILAVDNTFLTSYLQRPLELGADLSCYSLTKYMNGHSDVVMGAIVTNNLKYCQKLRSLQISMGIVPSPFDCYLVNRGLKTLSLRMRQHTSSALIVATFLESHPKVIKVIHPGLPSHPQHKIFKKQTSGHSGMVAFYLKGNLENTKKFLSHLKLFILADSLGGFESLVEIPSLMTHSAVPEDIRIKLNITDTLIRLSVGLEDVEDVVEDLKQAIDAS